jgi:hypothetical protein
MTGPTLPFAVKIEARLEPEHDRRKAEKSS